MKTIESDVSSPDLEMIAGAIDEHGYWIGAHYSSEGVKALIESLGEVIFTTDVTVKQGSKALVTSERALDFHTDHPKADLILWHCIEQSDQGGESIMLDAYELVAQLSSEEQELLRHTMLLEHKVFPDDPEQFPVLSKRLGRDKIYYSFWLCKDNLLPAHRDVFLAFKRITELLPPIRCLLKPGDVLVVDNGRMLHGRTAIQGNKKRLLKRYWIKQNL